LRYRWTRVSKEFFDSILEGVYLDRLLQQSKPRIPQESRERLGERNERLHPKRFQGPFESPGEFNCGLLGS
jgi:hypothetical protein